jgi:predicted lipase
MCGVSAFYEELFPLVRRINQKLPPAKKFRMLAGDPPIDWSKMKTAADFARGQFLMRDPAIASVMEKEVLLKHRKALMLFGAMHLYHSHGGNAPILVLSVVETYEKNHPGVTLVIADHTGFGTDSPLVKYNDEFESRMASWPIPSLVQDLPGTWLADLLDKTHTLGGGVIMFRVGKDGKRTLISTLARAICC